MSTEKAYNGTKEVFYIQVFNSNGEHMNTTCAYKTFPSSEEVEKALVIATGVYGFGMSAKVDKRYELNVVE